MGIYVELLLNDVQHVVYNGVMTRKDEAITLRRAGYSYAYIHEKTKLSKSTLSYHLRDIAYTPNRVTIEKIGKARAAAVKSKSDAKRLSVMSARVQARKDIGTLSKRDIFMLGLGVYIGEGSKTQNLIRVVNADYRVINLFITWLKTFGLENKNFRIRLHLYPESNREEAEEFWRKKTGLSKLEFQKACIDARGGKDKKRQGTHPYGTAHVTVSSLGNVLFGVGFSRRIGAWMEEVLE